MKRAVVNDGPTDRLSDDFDDGPTDHMLEDDPLYPSDAATDRMMNDGPTDRMANEGSGEHTLGDDLADTTIRTDRVFDSESGESPIDSLAETTTLPRRGGSVPEDSVLTDDDFDDYAPTVERRAPPVQNEPPPASTENTVTVTLKRDFDEAVTHRNPKYEEESSAPRPIAQRRTPSSYPPPPPPKAAPLPLPLPPPPPKKSLPPPNPPPRKASLPPIAPPPKKSSLPPPGPAPRTLPFPEPAPPVMSRRPPPKPPRPLQAPPVDPYFERVPHTVDHAARRSPSRPAPPSYGQNAPPSEDTRPFPLFAPQPTPPPMPAMAYPPARRELPSGEIPTTRDSPALIVAQEPELAPYRSEMPAAASFPAMPLPEPLPPYAPSTPPPPVYEPLPLPRTRRRRRPQTERTALAATIGICGALVAAGLIGTAMFLAFRSSDEPQTSASAPAVPTGTPAPTPQPTAKSVPSPPLPALAGCALAVRPGRIALSAAPNVLPMVAPAPGILRAAVGFSSSKNHADGLVVKLENLEVEPRYSEEFIRPVQRVTPLTDRAPVTFAVDHEDPRIHVVRTIPARPPFRVGTGYAGFVRMNDIGEPSVIWPGSRIEGIGDPTFAITERDGYGVAFRSGRNAGDIFVGWLTPQGTADGDLERIDAGPREVGPAAIAASDTGVIVVFAARAAGEPWRIRVATAPRAKVPKTSRQIDASSLNASDTIAPAVVALPQGGWLIQWLEGRQGARRVLARAFNDKLEPVGMPVEIASESGIQDVPGALVVRENRVLSVHYAASEKSVELWGAVLRCG